MTAIEQELARNMHIRERIENARERNGYVANQRNDLLMAYLDIIIEHHEAIGVLIEYNLVGSGFALVRVINETFYRALWVNGCATSVELGQLWKDDDFSFPSNMMQKIDQAYGTQDFFQIIKKASWKSMCSYAHSGLLQVQRRIGSDGKVGGFYSENEILEVLRAISLTLIPAAILLFKSAGYEKEVSEIEILAASYNVPPHPGSS